jgi:cell division protein FtsW (lipid II flippase)
MILPKFQFVGRHGINMLAGVYLAAAIANLIGKLVPSLRVATFVILSVCWILTGIAVAMREAEHGRESLATLGIGTLPPVIVGSAVVVLLARIVAHYEPTPGFSIILLEWGLFFWIGGYLLVMRDAYHKKKLEEDLANKPHESSNQSLEPTAGRRDDQI